MTDLETALQEPLPTLIRVLPENVTDPLGRPVLVLKISRINGGIPENFKLQLTHALDSILHHIGTLNKKGVKSHPPVFQYVALADLSDVATSAMVCVDMHTVFSDAKV